MGTRRLHLNLLLAFSVLFLTACASCAGGSGGTTTPPGPEPVQGRPELCDKACAHLRALGCPEGNPIFAPDWQQQAADEDGMVTCTEFCVDIEKSGTVTLDPGCAASVLACDALPQCTAELNAAAD